jgi:catechol 2,3-dioxygenase-like lactoylglutathione lyase family enzyme
MKRFHVHLYVDDLDRNISFYSSLFAAQPARVESDYAKWMLDDPPVNFAISARGHEPGLDHFGIQVDNDADLAVLKAQAQAAEAPILDEGQTTCCYSRSDKHWVTDPQGVAWEHFHTLENIPTFNRPEQSAAAACCAPAPTVAPAACCAPAAADGARKSCC